MPPRRAFPELVLPLLLAGGCRDAAPAAAGARSRLAAAAYRLGLASPAAAPALGPRDTVDLVVRTARRHPISRFVYGLNFAGEPSAWGGADTPPEVTLNRMGGNRLSAYNWETNYSNAGSDYRYQNDQLLSPSTVPGEAVRARAAATFARGAAFLATVPMLPYVAGDACNCDVGTSDAGLPARLAAHFKRNLPSRGADAPAAAGPSSGPDPRDREVHQDEFVAWAAHTFPGAAGDPARRLMFSLDNEPDLWHATHKEVQSDFGDDPRTPRLQTYDAFVDETIAFAAAVKRVLPEATVFGPALGTYTGYVTLGRHPKDDPTYGDWRTTPFLDVYLDRLRDAERRGGRRLVDVLDVHWYPAPAGGYDVGDDRARQDSAMVDARVQAPRSLWDPAYDERSWVTEVTAGPVRLLPRLRAQVAAHYPGTRLAVTEYYFGRGGDPSGGVAQADALGIFGREGVYAAAAWPRAALGEWGGDGRRAYAYLFGAFRMFLDYDGAGGRFGDVGVDAVAADPAAASVYASIDGRGDVVVVAINKGRAPRPVRLRVEHPAALASVRAYALTAAGPAPAPPPAAAGPNRFAFTMPPLSVGTLVLGRTPAGPAPAGARGGTR